MNETTARPGVALAGAALLAGLAGGIIGALLAQPQATPGPAPGAVVVATPAATAPAAVHASFADVAARALPAVVHVSLLEPAADLPMPFDPETGEPEPRPRLTEGSGFVIDPDGGIVTSRHLLRGNTRALVRFGDRRELLARVVGADATTDIALLQVEARGLPALRFGDAARLRVGDWVCAVGHPLRFEDTFTVGVLSSRGRKLFDRSFDAYLQTDAAINPGNSGGPLLDLAGDVVGVVAAVSNKGQGLAFAVPSGIAAEVVAALRRDGRVTRGYLGAQLRDVEPDLAALLQVPEARGAVIVDVATDGPAAAAGLRPYDVVTAVDGAAAPGADAVVAAIAARAPGAAVKLDVMRDGRATSATATLGERRASQQRPRPPAAPASPLGLEVEAGTGGGRPGVIVRRVLRPGPGLEQVEAGDVVLELNRVNVPDVEAWEKALARLAPGQPVFLYVHRPREGRKSLVKLRVEPGPREGER
ncbi:MAG: trypsin-like peptidase domain-containing protein [Vicinamibacteria bacterium]|nr:trypsin-like peptidase domain-containing protein [Vicinamibacteria bacterium]